MSFQPLPMFSLRRSGLGPAFSSQNDNPGFALFDDGFVRVGPVGKILFERNASTDHDLRGLKPVPWGGQAGIFVDMYSASWMRLRAEVRQGIRAHHGVVADFAADAFYDFAPNWRISGGPRGSLASRSYYQAYYGVSLGESVASGLSPYSPAGGLKSLGSTSAFAEYSRLMGPAAQSSLARERGSKDQLTIRLSATYRFDFSL